MSIYDVKIAGLKGETDDVLGELQGKTTLIVNVASRCGLTPQYEGLVKLQSDYEDRGFTVVGVPCNQFGEQEPGGPEEIVTFCSTTYGVDFPLTEKVEVNGEGRHELYQQLTSHPDEKGQTGDIRWNFEKFLIGPDGQIVARFDPLIQPDDLRDTIEANLPA